MINDNDGPAKKDKRALLTMNPKRMQRKRDASLSLFVPSALLFTLLVFPPLLSEVKEASLSLFSEERFSSSSSTFSSLPLLLSSSQNGEKREKEFSPRRALLSETREDFFALFQKSRTTFFSVDGESSNFCDKNL